MSKATEQTGGLHLTELRRLAEEATRGTWRTAGKYRQHVLAGDYTWSAARYEPQVRFDAAYIAAAEPAVVVALIDAVEALVAAIQWERRWVPGTAEHNDARTALYQLATRIGGPKPAEPKALLSPEGSASR